ncbi:MAG: hypothetical protein LBJ93_04360 [Clostridiales bacterium]|nr:hypothetical protein [Clostridiales bacterium]
MDLEFVKENISPNIFLDSYVKKNDVVKFKSVNDLDSAIESQKNKIKIINIDNVFFVSEDLLAYLYDININFCENTNLISIDFLDKKNKNLKLNLKTMLRYMPYKKSFIIKKLFPGEKVIVYNHDNNFIKIKTSENLIGYIKK